MSQRKKLEKYDDKKTNILHEQLHTDTTSQQSGAAVQSGNRQRKKGSKKICFQNYFVC